METKINQYKEMYFKIGRSNIQGIGLIAIKKIKKNTLVLTSDISNNSFISYEELRKHGIDEYTIDMLSHYYAKTSKGIELPDDHDKNKPNHFVCYINHSKNNNIDFIRNLNIIKYYSNRDIEPGEELVINYEKDGYSNEPNNFKDKSQTMNIKLFLLSIFIVFILIIFRKIKKN